MKVYLKIAGLLGCVGLALVGSWILLQSGPESVHAMRPDAPRDGAAPESAKAGPPVLSFTAPKPATAQEAAAARASAAKAATTQAASAPAINYYVDGDLVHYQAKDQNGVVRRVGQYVISLRKDEPAPRTKCLKKIDEDDMVIDHVRDPEEKCVEVKLTEETDFDPKRVPPGYVADRLQDGVWTEYSASGNKFREDTWLKGKLNGLSYSWDENGTLVRSGNYLEGMRDGIFSEWNSDGRLVEETTWKNNMREGTCRVYYPNGRIRAEGSYANDTGSGTWRYYNQDGSLARTADMERLHEKAQEKLTRLKQVAPQPPAGEARRVRTSSDRSR